MKGVKMERLVGAILLKAIEDWDDPKKRPEVDEFLESEWFNELLEVLSLEPNAIRNQLRNGTYQRVNIRAAYR
jgi:hypothetical protein